MIMMIIVLDNNNSPPRRIITIMILHAQTQSYGSVFCVGATEVEHNVTFASCVMENSLFSDMRGRKQGD